MTQIRLVRGDITDFAQAEAIVNAGNETLCGCFTPGHTCLDHQIHKKAGPDLHAECAAIMRGSLASAGDAIITRGYRIPSRYIVHAYGPNCHVVGKRADLLTKTYRRCLSVASRRGVRSIAFPTISTGLYGYPKSEAAIVALRAIREWVRSHPHGIDKVYVVIFSDEDHDAYLAAIENDKKREIHRR